MGCPLKRTMEADIASRGPTATMAMGNFGFGPANTGLGDDPLETKEVKHYHARRYRQEQRLGPPPDDWPATPCWGAAVTMRAGVAQRSIYRFGPSSGVLDHGGLVWGLREGRARVRVRVRLCCAWRFLKLA